MAVSFLAPMSKTYRIPCYGR